MLYDLVHLYNDLGICVTAYYLTGSTPLTIFYIIINRLGYLYKFYVDSMIKKKKISKETHLHFCTMSHIFKTARQNF